MGQGFESLQARHVVGVVQRLERQVVALEIMGSNPITHPIFYFSYSRGEDVQVGIVRIVGM